MRTLIDANVILRYVLNDIPEMAQKSAEIVRNGTFTTPEILAEVSYVLRRVYQMTREQYAQQIEFMQVFQLEILRSRIRNHFS